MAHDVLVVHDDPASVALISGLLVSVGRAHGAVGTVEEALAALRSATPPRLVLLAPGVDSGRGHVLLEELVQRPLAARPFIVVLGEAAVGFDYPVVPLPPGDDFLDRVLAPEREALLAAAEGARVAARDASVAERGRVQTLETHVNDLELQLALRQAEIERLRRDLETEKRHRARAEQSASTARDERSAERAELEARHAALTAAHAELEKRLNLLQQEHSAALASDATVRQHVSSLEQQLDEAAEALRAARVAFRAQLADSGEVQRVEHAAVAALEQVAQTLRAERSALEQQLRDARLALEAARAAHAQELAELREALAIGEAQSAETLRVERAAHAHALAAAEAQSVQGLDAAQATHHAALVAARADHAQELSDVRAAMAAEAALAAEALDAARALAAEHQRLVAEARAELDAERGRLRLVQLDLETAKGEAQTARERVKALESRSVWRLELPSIPVVAVPRSGNVGLGELARAAVELWHGRADVRLDLSVSAGVRRLWLRRGEVVAASSSVRSETLADRAVRDGLLAPRHLVELNATREPSLARQLEQLLLRGLLRPSEIDGLMHRYIEAVALEAFSEAETVYAVEDEAPAPELPQTAHARTLPALLAQSLRRALPADSHLALLGGAAAVPRLRAQQLDAEALGFSEPERRMVDAIDGRTPVSSLALASGLTAERAHQALAVAKVLGVIEVEPQRQDAGADEAASLARMYAQVQNADYFSILGLSRSADGEAVRRAHLALSQQFDPLRFAAHPDPALLHQAQVVYRHLKDAARALQDDRRRAEYARHLL